MGGVCRVGRQLESTRPERRQGRGIHRVGGVGHNVVGRPAVEDELGCLRFDQDAQLLKRQRLDLEARGIGRIADPPAIGCRPAEGRGRAGEDPSGRQGSQEVGIPDGCGNDGVIRRPKKKIHIDSLALGKKKPVRGSPDRH